MGDIGEIRTRYEVLPLEPVTPPRAPEPVPGPGPAPAPEPTQHQ